MNGEAVEESGGRESAPRELCIHEVLPGLVPRFEWGDIGVDDRAICHGAGDDLRITVCRGGGGDESGSVRLRWRQRMSNTAFSNDDPEREVLARKKSSTFSTCSSSSRASSRRISRHFSSSSSETMVYARWEGVNQVD